MSTIERQQDEEQVVLVDEDDVQVGLMGKLRAHREGLLHRAISVFVFDAANRMLLQRRAASKYHSPGLLSNTCCSHPRPGESAQEAARRRLREEMGIRSELSSVCSLIYRARVGRLIEYEFDHILVGAYDGEPVPNPTEVSESMWISLEALAAALRSHPERFTPWFRLAAAEVADRWEDLTGRELHHRLPRFDASDSGIQFARLLPTHLRSQADS